MFPRIAIILNLLFIEVGFHTRSDMAVSVEDYKAFKWEATWPSWRRGWRRWRRESDREHERTPPSPGWRSRTTRWPTSCPRCIAGTCSSRQTAAPASCSGGRGLPPPPRGGGKGPPAQGRPAPVDWWRRDCRLASTGRCTADGAVHSRWGTSEILIFLLLLFF